MATLSGEAGAHRLDAALGEQIRRLRKARNMSQERLAAAAGVTFQQIQKYERGANRVSFSRLVLIAEALQTPLSQLISGLTDAGESASELQTPGARDLVHAYAGIRSEGVRRCLVELVQELAEADEPEAPVQAPVRPRDRKPHP
jgi:transcriptional regulator with XRE-family HTH domain